MKIKKSDFYKTRDSKGKVFYIARYEGSVASSVRNNIEEVLDLPIDETVHDLPLSVYVYIERNKKQDSSLRNALVRLNQSQNYDVKLWELDNEEKFVKAWFKGCSPKRENMYIVRIQLPGKRLKDDENIMYAYRDIENHKVTWGLNIGDYKFVEDFDSTKSLFTRDDLVEYGLEKQERVKVPWKFNENTVIHDYSDNYGR